MARLKLTLTAAGGGDLNDFVSVQLFSLNSSAQFQANQRVTREMIITGIDAPDSGAFFRVQVIPANHRIIQFLIRLAGNDTAEHSESVPVDPAKVVSVSAPAFTALADPVRNVLNTAAAPRFNDGQGGYLQGPGLYAALDQFPLLKAGFLNIVAKAGDVDLQDGQTCAQHFGSVLRFEQDRVLFRTTAALVEETAESNGFHKVSGALHEPLSGYQIISSYKTFDRYGNLQLTFQRRGDIGNDYVVDVDIDDAQGVEHVFQVLRNSVNGPTNPYDIHDILLEDQHLDPGYSFVFAKAATAA